MMKGIMSVLLVASMVVLSVSNSESAPDGEQNQYSASGSGSKIEVNRESRQTYTVPPAPGSPSKPKGGSGGSSGSGSGGVVVWRMGGVVLSLTGRPVSVGGGLWVCRASELRYTNMSAFCRPDTTTPAPAPAPGPAGPRDTDRSQALTVSSAQVASLIVGGSGVTRSPDTGKVPAGYLQIVTTDPTTRTYTLTLNEATVTVEATPVHYTWDWGDDTAPTHTTDPGSPWPAMSLTHCYTHPQAQVTMTVTTTWQATYTTGGTTHPVDGNVTTTSTSTPFDVVRLASTLTDHAEQAHEHHHPLLGTHPPHPHPTPNPLACTTHN